MQPKQIRSFARGLAVLAALNRNGRATALTLARETGVPRATVYRLLQTLLDDGYVGRGTADDRFHLLLKVRCLSGGFEDEQWIAQYFGPMRCAGEKGGCDRAKLATRIIPRLGRRKLSMGYRVRLVFLTLVLDTIRRRPLVPHWRA